MGIVVEQRVKSSFDGLTENAGRENA